LTILPQICMVSVDRTTGRNLVIWDRNSTRVFKQYNVYRQGTVTGYYIKLGIVPYKSLGVFEDTMVNPKSQAYMYKITATDYANNETDLSLCTPHKTIHLLVTQGVPKGFQLDWDEYIGFDYSTFKIYRSIDSRAFENAQDIATTSHTWTDFNAPSGYLQYYVAVQSPATCTPTALTKSESGPFIHSISNLEDNRLRITNGIQSYIGSLYSVAPNPTSDRVVIRYPLITDKNATIKIVDLTGKIIFESLLPESSNEITISLKEHRLADGIYLIRLLSGKQQCIQKVCKFEK
jgi:hypothetical protein